MTRFIVTLAPISGDTIDPILRLRAALKTLLRSHRLRCVHAVEESSGTGDFDATGSTSVAPPVSGNVVPLQMQALSPQDPLIGCHMP